MMSTKLNFTDRVEIDENDLDAQIIEDSNNLGSYEIQLSWNLVRHDLVTPFDIVFSCKALGETLRFSPSQSSSVSASEKFSLNNMRNALETTVGIKVVHRDSKNIPVVIASLNNLIPRLPNRQSARRSLLKTMKDPALHVPWRLMFDDGIPVLHITDEHDLYGKLTDSTPEFDSLILPEIVRQIFDWLVFSPEDKDQFYCDGWKSIFENLGCPRTFFDQLSSPDDEGGIDGMSISQRRDVRERSYELSDEFANEMNLLAILSGIEMGEE